MNEIDTGPHSQYPEFSWEDRLGASRQSVISVQSSMGPAGTEQRDRLWREQGHAKPTRKHDSLEGKQSYLNSAKSGAGAAKTVPGTDGQSSHDPWPGQVGPGSVAGDRGGALLSGEQGWKRSPTWSCMQGS